MNAFNEFPKSGTQSGLFTLEDIHNIKPALRAGLEADAGKPPYTRGPYTSMYQQKPWTIRQYTGFGSASDTNQAFKTSLAEGAQGLSVAFDLPTHLGFDSDHPLAAAEVGLTGVAIDSVEDMKRLFDGIDLSRTSVSMTMNGAVLPVLAAFIVAAEESGTPAEQLRGTIQNDILKEFMVRNTWIHAPEPSLRICTDVVSWLSQHAPGFNSQSISGYHFQEGGASPALELALTLANAAEYLDRLTGKGSAAGLSLDEVCPRLSFFFGVGMNFFDEIAKLRAARLLWSEEVTGRGGNARSARMKIHCQTSGWSLTAQEPRNNLIRTTIEAMAAVFGGTQSLHTNGYDEALSIPTDESARLARNTQLILQTEAGLTDAIDPWGGSYMMESLTANMVTEVRDWLARIQQQGGVIAAIEKGWVQSQLHQQALATQAKLDSGIKKQIGANTQASHQAAHQATRQGNHQASHKSSDQSTQSEQQPIRHLDAAQTRSMQLAQLDQLKRSRDGIRVRQSLFALQQATRDINAFTGQSNLLQLTINAIRARATVGECVEALTKVWPRYNGAVNFQGAVYGNSRQNDPSWKRIKQMVSQFSEQHDRSPEILLSKLGLDGHDRGIRVIAAGLNDLGFNVHTLPLFTTPEQLAEHCQYLQPDAVGISLLSGAHMSLIRELKQKLNRSGQTRQLPIWVGGLIHESDQQALQQLGIAQVFGPGSRIEDIAMSLLSQLKALPEKNTKRQEPLRRSKPALLVRQTIDSLIGGLRVGS